MSDPQPDADLRDAFQQLRSEDRAAAPDFTAMMERVREDPAAGEARFSRSTERGRAGLVGWRRRSRWLLAGGTLAAAALVAFMLFNPEARADREFERTVETFTTAVAGWRSPTDALLDFPGSEMTRSVPRVGDATWPSGTTGQGRRNRS